MPHHQTTSQVNGFSFLLRCVFMWVCGEGRLNPQTCFRAGARAMGSFMFGNSVYSMICPYLGYHSCNMTMHGMRAMQTRQ